MSNTITVQDLLKQIERKREALSLAASMAERLIQLVDQQLMDMMGSDDLLGKQHDLLLLLSQGNPKPRDVRKFAITTQILLESSDRKMLTPEMLLALIETAASVTPKVSKRQKGVEVASSKSRADPKNKKSVKKTTAKSKTKKRGKKTDSFGIYAATGKMFETAFLANSYPETLETFLELVFGPAWRSHDFYGYKPGIRGVQHQPLGLDIEMPDSMLKRAIANGYHSLARCETDWPNANTALKNLYGKIVPKHTISGIKLILRDKWGIDVQ